MKIESNIVDGEAVITLSEVYSGIGIKTDLGLFGIAQRDDGIEVMLDGFTVWTSHEIPGVGPVVGPLPDGSGFFTASFPLPKTHWVYAEGRDERPSPVGVNSVLLHKHVVAAVRYAIRDATRNGTIKDFDPDCIVQQTVVALLGTRHGRLTEYK